MEAFNTFMSGFTGFQLLMIYAAIVISGLIIVIALFCWFTRNDYIVVHREELTDEEKKARDAYFAEQKLKDGGGR